MSINRRISIITEHANAILRKNKSDIVVLVVPTDDNEKGWMIDICHDSKTGDEETKLREHLENCTFDELTEELHEYASNIPKGRPIRRRLK